MEETRARLSFWDNTKAVLIFLVVLGHYLGYGYVYGGDAGGLKTVGIAIYGFIYMFHMPLFAFVSGFFAKNLKKGRETAISRLLLPYLIFNTACILLNRVLLHVPLSNPVFAPYNHMWYLFALFLWRYTAVDAVKLPCSWLWAVLFSLFCSVFGPGKDWDIISRAITFWPFFLLGLSANEGHVEKVRTLPKWLCGLVLLGMLCFSILAIHSGAGSFRLCFLARTVSHDRAGLLELFKEILRYLTALVLGVCVLNLVPAKKTWLTTIGQNTMTVFLLHSLPGLRNLMNYLNPFGPETLPYLLWCVLWALAATVLFGQHAVGRAYDRLMEWIRGLFPAKA